MRRQSRPNRSEIGPAITILNKLHRRMLRSNSKCLLPEDASVKHSRKPNGTHDMRDCHIIGEKFLKRIAPGSRSEILCWPISVVALGNDQISRLKGDKDDIGYAPVLRSTNNDDCKFTFACHNHDNEVFKKIDTFEHFDFNDNETQFLLGFRAMAAHTALIQGHRNWSMSRFLSYPEIRRLLKRFPQLRSIEDWMSRHWDKPATIAICHRLDREMERWREAYLQTPRPKVATEIRIAKLNFKVAATRIEGEIEDDAAVIPVTILPINNAECAVIATSLDSSESSTAMATEWGNRLENSRLQEWLPTLAGSFCYFSQDEYKSIPIEQRKQIESNMIESYLRGMFHISPD